MKIKVFLSRVFASLAYRDIPVASWLARQLQFMDDFDWSSYADSEDYESTVGPFGSDFETAFTISLKGSKSRPKAGEDHSSVLETPILYPTHSLLVDVASRLEVTSAFEFGFGSGAHILNLWQALEKPQLGGADISSRMMEKAIDRFSTIEFSESAKPNLIVNDMTMDRSRFAVDQKYELVYCHQVLLHIHRPGAAINFLKNMYEVSSRYILLIENVYRHNLCSLIRRVMPQMRCYYVANKYSNALLIDKKNALDLPILTNDRELRKKTSHVEDNFLRFISQVQAK